MLAILLELWRGRYIVISTIATFVLTTIIVLRILGSPQYFAQATIQLKENRNTAQLNLGIAALTGHTDTAYEKFKLTFDSYLLAKLVNQKYHVAQALFPNEWNPNTKTWHPPASLFFEMRTFLSPIFGLYPWHPPGTDEVQEFIKDRVSIVRLSDNSQLVALGLKFGDRRFAQDFLSDVIKQADEIQRRRELRNDNLEYRALDAAIAGNAGRSEKQSSQSELITQLARLDVKRLILSSGAPYAFEVVDPVWASKYPVPRRIPFFLSVLGLIGAIVGMLLVFVWNALRESYSTHSEKCSDSHVSANTFVDSSGNSK